MRIELARESPETMSAFQGDRVRNCYPFAARRRALASRAVMLAAVIAICAAGCGGGSGPSAEEKARAANLHDEQVYESGELRTQRDIVYSVRPNADGAQMSSDLLKDKELGQSSLSLALDVTIPPNATPATPQPVLVWIHGGGLVEGNKETIQPYVEAWARAGYVGVTVNYRLTPGVVGDAGLRASTVRDAAEDIQNAVRYLKAHAAQFHLDPSRVALIGYSSGGVASLEAAYSADALDGTSSDWPGVSAHASALAVTGATFDYNGLDTSTLPAAGPGGTRAMLMHAMPEDGVTHTTWDGQRKQACEHLVAAGHDCVSEPQPDLSHMADLNFPSPFGQKLNRFLIDTFSRVR
jgi:acetyl esterase/lipase